MRRKFLAATIRFGSLLLKFLSTLGITRIGVGRANVGNLITWAARKALITAAGKAPKAATTKGFTMYLGGAKEFQPGFLTGDYEAGTTRVVEGLLNEGCTFVDLGAHIGYYTLLAAKLVGKTGRVYSFEPDPGNFVLLFKNVTVNDYTDRVIPVQKAIVGHGERDKRLYFHSTRTSSSSLYTLEGGRPESIAVEAVSLDEFFASIGWPKVDVVKMDIEGAEKEALEGMHDLVSRNPRLRLIVDYNELTISAAGVTAEEFIATLKSLGFVNLSFCGAEGPIPLKLPDELSKLRKLAKKEISGSNLLCEQASSEI